MKNRDIPDWMDPEVWVGFQKHRKLLKKPMTDRAEFLILKRLEKAKDEGYDPNALLDEAIEKGWQTIYPKPQHLTRYNDSNAPPPMYRGTVLNPDYQEWLANKEFMELNGTADTPSGQEARNEAVRSLQRANLEHKTSDLAGETKDPKPRCLN